MTLHPEAQKLADHLFSLAPAGVEEFLEFTIAGFAENNPHDPADDIIPGWGVEDVYQVVEERFDATISKEDAIAVLTREYKTLDANHGVNWDSLEDTVQELISEGAISLIEGDDD
jgi:hypothetical protein